MIAGVSIYFISGHLFAPSPTLAIQDISVSDITATGAVVTWLTDKPATSQAEYGSTVDYGLATALDEELVTSHRVELAGLQPDTTCCVRVISRDASGYEAMSDTQWLKTLPLETTPTTASIPTTPSAEKPPASLPPAELSFEARTYTNDEYGFSVQYPSDWVERPEVLTGDAVAAFGVQAFVPGISILVVDADKPVTADWLVASYGAQGNKGVRVVSPITETTLADGTPATVCKMEYVALSGYYVVSFGLEADKDGKRVRVVVWTIELDMAPPYDEARFSEIAHTLRFTSPPAPPPAELSFEAKTYTNDEYGFSVQYPISYPTDWGERPELLTHDAVAAFGVPNFVPGIVIRVIDADKPVTADWLVVSYEGQGNESAKVVSPLTQTTLADGTTATVCKMNYVSATGYPMVAFDLEADKGGERIRIIVWTIQEYFPYDEAKFSEIAHTLRFTAE